MGAIIFFIITGAMGIIMGLAMPNMIYLIMGLFVGGIGVLGLSGHKKEKNEEKAKEKYDNQARIDITNEWAKISKDFPYEDSVQLSIKLLDKDLPRPFLLHMAFKDETIFMMPNKDNTLESYRAVGYKKPFIIRIPTNKIHYYLQSGDVLTNVSGSGGGSAYDILYGWNGRVSDVNIKTTILDTKHTQLFYEENGSDRLLTFAYNDFHKFKKMIPLKDYAIIQELIVNNQRESKTTKEFESESKKADGENAYQFDFSSKLRSIKQLLDDGILTEEEYNSKKQEILSRM